jgi:hypothetical protein
VLFGRGVFGKYIVKFLGKDRCQSALLGAGLRARCDAAAVWPAETRSDGGRGSCELSPQPSESTDKYGYNIVGTPRIRFP